MNESSVDQGVTATAICVRDVSQTTISLALYAWLIYSSIPKIIESLRDSYYSECFSLYSAALQTMGAFHLNLIMIACYAIIVICILRAVICNDGRFDTLTLTMISALWIPAALTAVYACLTFYLDIAPRNYCVITYALAILGLDWTFRSFYRVMSNKRKGIIAFIKSSEVKLCQSDSAVDHFAVQVSLFVLVGCFCLLAFSFVIYCIRLYGI